MKFQLTKRKILIGLIILVILGITIVIIGLLNPGIIPHGCGSGYLCKNPGSQFYKKCVHKDFCGHSGLVDNQADCNCKVDCPAGQQSFPASVNMKKDPLDSTKWIPDGPKPVCGIPCAQATSTTSKVHGAKQGVGYCAAVPDQYCGVGNIHVQGQTRDVWKGCFPKDKWTQCGQSLCETPTDGSNPCTSEGICQITDYCGKDNKPTTPNQNVYQACKVPSDCHDMYGNEGTCALNSNTILTNKNITEVGYCTGQKLHFPPASHNSHCTTLDKIGNDKAHDLVVCTGTAVGVDGSIQCKDSDAAKGCAPYGICSKNYWQAYYDASKNVLSCLPNKKYDSTKKPLCCSKDRIIVSSEANWCCPVKNTTDCSNTTAYPYSANMLSIPNKTYTDSIDCTVTKGVDSCTTHNPQLIKSLTVSGFTPSSKPGDANFATLFCDTSIDPTTQKPINKCKAKCGYVDSLQGIESDYAVSNDATTDPNNKISFCTPKKNNCSLLTPQSWDNVPNPVNNIPICYDSDHPPTGKPTDKFYWSGPDDHKTTYQTQFSRDMTGNNCNTPNMCAKLGSDINGIYSIEPGTNSCKFTVNCNKDFMMKPSGMDSMKWSDGLTGLDDTNWTTCSDGTICPNKTKAGTVINTPCPCSNEAMWKPIAQSIPYTADSSTQKCSGVINGTGFSLPTKLTVPLQYYDGGKCHGDTQLEIKTHLNTTGEYCPNGIVPETNQCYQP